MTAILRLIDTGLKPARWNIAMTAALSELHRTGRIPDTLRFHVYPRSVLIGRHQALRQSVNVAACREREIEVARRVTGGGAIYMAPGVLAWDFVAGRGGIGAGLGETGAALCGAVAAGLSRLGLAARYRPANAIEIGGRKVSGASGYFDGPTVVYQGTVLIDADLDEMADVLVLPSAAPALREQVVTVKERLGRMPDMAELAGTLVCGISHSLGRTIVRAESGEDELRLADALHEQEIGSDAFVDGVEFLPDVAPACMSEASAKSESARP